MEETKCKCGGEAQKPHTCPFLKDIHADYSTLCNCCAKCQQNCADEI